MSHIDMRGPASIGLKPPALMQGRTAIWPEIFYNDRHFSHLETTMRLSHLLLLIVSIAALSAGCYSDSTAKSKGQLISDCMSAGGTPEECDRQYNR